MQLLLNLRQGGVTRRSVSAVCVCAPCSHRDSFELLFTQQGGAEHSGDCTQRSYPLVLEAEPDQLCVPA